MKRTNYVPNSTELTRTCSKNATPMTNELIILEPQESYLNNEVIEGFKIMFKDNDKYIKHLNNLNKFRHYAADILENDPSLHDKLFPLFDTCNRLAGVLLLNSAVSERLNNINSYIISK